MKKLISIIFLCQLLITSCANTATIPALDEIMQISFNVKGKMILDNPNITYYLVFNAPVVEEENQVVDINTGPRINAPNLNSSSAFLDSRLPFVGQLPEDQKSVWTDFFFITFEGKTIVGKGSLDQNNTPVIETQNYTNINTKPLSENGVINGYQIEIPLKELFLTGEKKPKNITANIAVSDSINLGGVGAIYDSWLNNTPFSIDLGISTPQSQPDNTSGLALKPVPNRVLPSVPSGINADDLDIASYTVRILGISEN